MGKEPGFDALDLWRGIDDAIWREAGRAAEPSRKMPVIAMTPRLLMPPAPRPKPRRTPAQRKALESA